MVTRRSPKKAPRLTAIAYIRVSTEEQDLGLDAQRDAIKDWAVREGVEVLAWHDEKVTGGAELHDRGAMLRALADVKARRASYLVAYRLDRLGRDPLTALLVGREVERARARIVYVTGGGAATSDPTSKLLRTVLLGVAEFEKDMIGARTKAALAVKRDRGDALGRPGRERYGFRTVDGPMQRGKDGVERPTRLLAEEPAEQATLARARELYAIEGVGLRAVAAALTAEGRFNRKGRAFGLEELSKMVKGAAT
jgi:site-specific DNA recombinase